MRLKLALSAAAVITALSVLPAGADPISIPVVVLTVPVSLEGLDGEYFKTLYVGCSITGEINGGTVVVANGDAAIPLVVVPATPSTRSTASFKGKVTVNLLSDTSVGIAYKAGAGKTDPETAAMDNAAATIRAIGKLGTYTCALETTPVAKTRNYLQPLDSTATTPDPKVVTQTVGTAGVKSTTATVLVTSRLAP